MDAPVAKKHIPEDHNIFDTSQVPTCERFMNDDTFLRYLQGPFGSGKSSACVQEVVKRASMQVPNHEGVRKSRCAVVRNTYRQLEDTTIKTFLDWFPDRVWGQFKVGDVEFHMRFALPDQTIVECEVLFRALDRPDQVSNLLSLELTFAWLNEMREIEYEIFDAIQGRVGRYPSMRNGGPTWDGVFGDSNPPDDQHWIYQLFEETRPENCKAFYQPSGLSPQAENLKNLRPGYYTRLKIGKSKDYIRVYIEGKYGYLKDGKPVFPEYEDTVHTRDIDYIPNLGLYRGWDFGRTPSLVLTQLNSRGQWLIIDELVSDNMGIQRFLEEADAWMGVNYPGAMIAGDYCDPSGGNMHEHNDRTSFDYMLMHGLTPEGGEQSITTRLEAVRKPLNTMRDGEPMLLVSPRCKMVRKGFNGGYRYRRMKVAGNRFTDKPDKNEFSHPMDCVQYVATRLFGKYSSEEDEDFEVVGGIHEGRHIR